MARTISEIKKDMTDRFMADESIRAQYELSGNESFDAVFSKICIESILFFIVAACVWTVEVLFDAHRSEVQAIIAAQKPHTIRWYVDKSKRFMLGKPLMEGTDEYDVAGMTDEEIEALRVVKYAAATEAAAIVYLKVATEDGGEPKPLDAAELASFTQYIAEVKDAGVRVVVVNEPAEYFRIHIAIYYNPMVLGANGMNLATAEFPVQDTIRGFIKDLPFNGEYQNVLLVDALQKIEGVAIPELQLAETKRYENGEWEAVDAKATPYSGYYKVYDDADMDIEFIAYV